MQDDVLAVKYRDFLREYESLDHMSCLGPVKNDDSFRVFIPHHPIIRDYSQTMKLRVVFNASRPTCTNVSINDCFHVGPKLQNEICSILLRWRQHPYVLCADIARKFQCILWREALNEPVKIFELNTITYGMSYSPYLAVRQLAEDEKIKFPLAAPAFSRETYVDDLFFGRVDQLSTLALRDQLIQLASSGGFRLRKWFSNCSARLSYGN